jgi:hypothetical protein
MVSCIVSFLRYKQHSSCIRSCCLFSGWNQMLLIGKMCKYLKKAYFPCRYGVLLDQPRDVVIVFWASCILPTGGWSPRILHALPPLLLGSCTKCTLHQFWDSSLEWQNTSSPQIQQRHLFADLANSHLWYLASTNTTAHGVKEYMEIYYIEGKLLCRPHIMTPNTGSGRFWPMVRDKGLFSDLKH